MKKIIYLSLLPLFLVGCATQRGETELIDLKKEASSAPLTSKVIFESGEIGFINSLTLRGDYIILEDGYPNVETFFYALDKASGELVSKFGRRGRASNELLQPIVVSNNMTYNDDKSFDVVEWQLNMLYTLSLEDINKVEIVSKIKLPAEISRTDYVHKLGDNYLGKKMAPAGNELFLVVNSKNDSIVRAQDYFDTDVKIEATSKSYYYAAKLMAHPDKDVVIAGMTFFDYVDVYDLEGLKKRYQFSENPLPDLSDRMNVPMYSMSGYCGKEYCYLIRKNQVAEGEPKSVSVLVFDYDGQFKKAYNFDRNFNRLCVDETTNKLYGSDLNSDTGVVSLFEFQL